MTLKHERQQPGIPCVVLAGGHSRRFGTPKGLAKLKGQTLLQHVVQRIDSQGVAEIVVNADDDGPYANHEIKLVPDQAFVDEGPLAGLRTALFYAHSLGMERVLTVPIDTPFIPLNLVQSLLAAGDVSVAMSKSRLHPVCGLWTTNLLELLDRFLEGGHRSARNWVKECSAEIVQFDEVDGIDPFFNINTVRELKIAEGKLH